MLKLENVDKVYKIKDDTMYALKNINYSFEKSGFYLISGKSGCGKTTLLNLIAGFEKCSGGCIFSDYKSNEIGYVTQTIYPLEDFTLYQNLAVMGYRDEAIIQVLKIVNLEGKKNSKVRVLSGGERQRLSIAIIILKDCKLLLLDEPTGSLDEQNSLLILNLLKQLSKDRLVIMTSHQYQQSRIVVDYEILLKEGQIWESKNHKSDLNFDVEEIVVDNSNKPFSFWWQIKYLCMTFKTQLFNHLVSFFMIFLTLMISLVLLGINTFNLKSTLAKSLEESNVDYLPLYREVYSSYSEQAKNISKGNDLYQQLTQLSCQSFPYIQNVIIDSSLNRDIHPTLIILPDDYICSDVVGDSGVVITDFLQTAYALNIQDKLSLQIQSVTQKFSFSYTITGIQKTGIKSQEMTTFLNKKEYRDRNKEKLDFHYAIIFMKESIFKKSCFEQDINLFGSGFDLNEVPLKYYVDNQKTYSIYQEEELLFGQAPQERIDVVISRDIYQILYNNSSFSIKEVDLRDIRSSKNKELYQDYFNLFDLTSKIRIVGVSSEQKNTVFITKSLYNELFTQMNYYQYSGYAILNERKAIKDIASTTWDNQFLIDLSLPNSVYSYNQNKDQFLISFIYLLPIFLLITCLIILYTGFNQVKKKDREIIFFRSFGISSKRITIPFLLLELSKGIVAYLLAIPFANIIFHKISYSFILSQTISFLTIHFTTFLFTFLICIFLIAFSTILPIWRAYKKEIGLAIKDCR